MNEVESVQAEFQPQLKFFIAQLGTTKVASLGNLMHSESFFRHKITRMNLQVHIVQSRTGLWKRPTKT